MTNKDDNSFNTYRKSAKIKNLTKDTRNEGHTVGQHGALDHIQLREDHEDEQGQAHDVHGLEDPDHQEVGEGGFAVGLEDAYPSRTDQSS